MNHTGSGECTRREFACRSLQATTALAATGASLVVGGQTAPSVIRPEGGRPVITSGVASGDVSATGAILWSRCDRPAQMIVELSATETFRKKRVLRGPCALEHRDFTAKLAVTGLPPGERTFYRVRFEDLERRGIRSEPVVGSLITAPQAPRDISFVWSGDTAGQGYGIDTARGGMTSYAAMGRFRPDFFVHSGDVIYADNPFPETITLDDGSIWRNVVTPETSKVAETLDEFRGNYRYNLLDEHLRAFHASVPVFAQWDDHETLNNWYPGELLDDARYTIKSVDLLAARARTAFFEYLPLRESLATPGRIYRAVDYGPLLQLVFLDLRSHRGPNTGNHGTQPQPENRLLGRTQLAWLKRVLTQSRATWKVVCSDMPLGLIVGDGPGAFEAVANGDGPAQGRELEIADLLRHLQEHRVRNVVWLTADVHYAASHYYDPSQAVFQQFDPFWEFVSGPLHAGTFGPGKLDQTFGPQVRFQSIPDDMRPNRPPSEGLQFFGHVRIDGQSRTMTVSHYNAAGEELWRLELPAV